MKIGSVLEDKKGNLWRLNEFQGDLPVLNKISNGVITGDFKVPWILWKKRFKIRKDLKYDLQFGVQSK